MSLRGIVAASLVVFACGPAPKVTACTSCDCGAHGAQPAWVDLPGLLVATTEVTSQDTWTAPSLTYGVGGGANAVSHLGGPDGGTLDVSLAAPFVLAPSLADGPVSWTAFEDQGGDYEGIAVVIRSGDAVKLISHVGVPAQDETPSLSPATGYQVDFDAGTVTVQLDGQALTAPFDQTASFQRQGQPWCLAAGSTRPDGYYPVIHTAWALYPLDAVVRLER